MSLPHITSGLRPDIQGLRAIAVLAVVIFHILPYTLTGGYLGVDMFFVISGFVVTQRLSAQWQRGELNIGAFYRSRFVRLAPALLTMLLASTVAASWLLLPAELDTFAQHLLGVLTFSVNFLLIADSGYFAPAAESLPLLHTWSLAVEEHFYLVLPAIFLLFRPAQFRRLLTLLALVCCISFAAGLLLQQSYPELSFYLSPLRFYQFLLGCLAAALPLKQRPGHLFAELFCLSAALLLLYCFVSYDKYTLPLGLPSLLPTFCTALLLVVLPASRLSSFLLSVRPLKWIGDSSYSIYLWHWPIIVFYKMAGSARIDLITAAMLFIASLAAGYLSYVLIEQPWRGRGPFANLRVYRNPISVHLVIAFMLACAATLIVLLDGLPQRLTAQQQADAGYLQQSDHQYRQSPCFLTSEHLVASAFNQKTCLTFSQTKANVLLLGDSHAAHLAQALQQTGPQYHWLQANATGCKPLLPLQGRAVCTSLYQQIIFPLLERQPPAAIVLSANWQSHDLVALKNTVSQLSRYAPVYVIGPSVQYLQPLPRLLTLYSAQQTWSDLSTQQHTRALDIRLQQAISGIDQVHYLSLYQQQCPADQCWLRAPDGAPLLWDRNHFTQAGSLLVAPGLLRQLAVNARQP